MANRKFRVTFKNDNIGSKIITGQVSFFSNINTTPPPFKNVTFLNADEVIMVEELDEDSNQEVSPTSNAYIK